MAFLSPWMLGALAAVAVPIIIHLLNKFRVRKTDWGAMRFLLESMRKNERRVKMEDLLLLLLRCALVVLAALAFARPVLQALAVGSGDSSSPEATIVLLDNSASMGQSAGVETRFDMAKTAVREWSEKQGGQSQGALFLVSNRTEPLLGKPTGDWGLFRKSLGDAELSDRGSELAQGVRLAMEALQSVAGRRRVIRIYTDGQSAAWSHGDELRALAKEHPEVRIESVLISSNDVSDNLSVTALRAEGGILAANQPARFLVEIGNFSAKPAESVKVTFTIDDGAPGGDVNIARIEPGQTQSATVMLTFTSPGPHSVTASIGPDSLAADNRRVAAFDVVSQMNVIVGDADPKAPSFERDSFFVANAMVPLAPDQASRHYLATLIVQPREIAAELGNANNTSTQAIVLCNPGALSPEITDMLRKYVQGGGSVVIFPGPSTDPVEWKANAPLWEMLPAELAPATDEASAEAAIPWQDRDFTHPITALWNDAAQGSLGSVKVSRHFPLTLKPNGARVIAALSNGEPAMVEWAFGDGRVVLFNSTATPAWNNLPLHPAFVPLMQRTLGYLTRQSEKQLALSPGEAFRKRVPDAWNGKDFAVQKPGAEQSRTAGQITGDERQAFIRYAATEKAGTYRVSVDGTPAGIFAVQLDPAESDLRAVDPGIIEELRNASKSGAAAATANESRMIVTRDFWTPLIWIAALVFVLEAALAHWLSHTRHA